jgi:hypothetical protein
VSGWPVAARSPLRRAGPPAFDSPRRRRPRRRDESGLEQLLPLDEERREETAVYFAFRGRPVTDVALREIRAAADAASRQAVAAALSLLAEDGRPDPSRDPEAEADRLYPLIDGLSLHGTLWPERFPPEHLRRVLADHLRSLER